MARMEESERRREPAGAAADRVAQILRALPLDVGSRAEQRAVRDALERLAAASLTGRRGPR